MNYPPRLAHLATRPIVRAKLTPTYAMAHEIDEEEAAQRLETVLAGALWEQLLASTWSALKGHTKRLTDDGLLEKVAKSLTERPMRPGKVATLNPAWSAFLVRVDLELGTASEAARRLLESVEGQKKMQQGLDEVGRYLAAELTR